MNPLHHDTVWEETGSCGRPAGCFQSWLCLWRCWAAGCWRWCCWGCCADAWRCELSPAADAPPAPADAPAGAAFAAAAAVRSRGRRSSAAPLRSAAHLTAETAALVLWTQRKRESETKPNYFTTLIITYFSSKTKLSSPVSLQPTVSMLHKKSVAV